MNELFIVTGALGHLGNTIIRYLMKQNVEIRGLIMPHEKSPHTQQVQYSHGDVRDLKSLLPLFEHIENKKVYVIHTAGIISMDEYITPLLYEVNVRGVRNVVSLCLQKHVYRFIYVSSVHALKQEDGIISETSYFSSELVKGGYAKTKAEATSFVLSSVNLGLNGIVVLPSGIIGPYGDSSNYLVQFINDYIHYHLWTCVKGGYDFVDVRDVAMGCLLAARKGRVGECYILSSQYYEMKSLLNIVKQIHEGPRLVMVPTLLAKACLPIIQGLAKLKKQRPLYTPYSLYTITHSHFFSHQKASEELGYTTRPMEVTLKDTVLWLTKGKSN